MADNIYRPGSKLHDAYAVYLKKGIDAAVAHGLEIGLSATTMKIQTKRWGVTAPISIKGEAKVPSAKRAAGMNYLKQTKKLLTVSYIKDPARNKAYLIAQGPQQSIVCFVHSGSEDCIPNEWLGLPIDRREPSTVRRYDL